ncbi:hypothetical protein AUR64_16435 [Haloprofundus marisrubri]|uniref:Uncharacterized protein n=1 Tax=Haloprofundus marisrubri TaxID=1514971 RepID=A0A0W1R746_9EURY|nr:hypothetical protein [Haloprofundus marisrubri]KTG09366.1 hypothetical protein AUR64_16435 [Haloprofundus marisrubri]
MLAELVTPMAALTAAVGLFVSAQAYRGYRRNESRTMRALAVGVFCLTVVPFVVSSVAAPVAGLSDARILLGVSVAYVAGLGSILYSLVRP